MPEQHEPSGKLRDLCEICGEPVGVFERAVWRLPDGSEISGSVLHRPAPAAGNPLAGVLHGACVSG